MLSKKVNKPGHIIRGVLALKQKTTFPSVINLYIPNNFIPKKIKEYPAKFLLDTDCTTRLLSKTTFDKRTVT